MQNVERRLCLGILTFIVTTSEFSDVRAPSMLCPSNIFEPCRELRVPLLAERLIVGRHFYRISQSEAIKDEQSLVQWIRDTNYEVLC